MVDKLHVGDEVEAHGEVRRLHIRWLRDYERHRPNILTPLELPTEDPQHYYEMIGVVLVKEDYVTPKKCIILGWTAMVTGNFVRDERKRRAFIDPKRTQVIAVQPWNNEGKYRKPKFCLLEQLRW